MSINARAFRGPSPGPSSSGALAVCRRPRPIRCRHRGGEWAWGGLQTRSPPFSPGRGSEAEEGLVKRRSGRSLVRRTHVKRRADACRRPAASPHPNPQHPQRRDSQQDHVQHDHQPDGTPGEDVHPRSIPVATHDPGIVDQQDHEDQHDRQQEALQVLRRATMSGSRSRPGIRTTSAPMPSTNV